MNDNMYVLEDEYSKSCKHINHITICMDCGTILDDTDWNITTITSCSDSTWGFWDNDTDSYFDHL